MKYLQVLFFLAVAVAVYGQPSSSIKGIIARSHQQIANIGKRVLADDKSDAAGSQSQPIPDSRGTMEKHDLVDAGFSVIIPSDAQYESELKKLGFDRTPDAEVIRPFTVVLNNSSKHSVVAFALRWTMADAAGNLTTHDRSYIAPWGLLDGGRPKREEHPVEQQIRAGTSRLITVNGMIRTQGELRELSAGPLVSSSGFSVVAIAVDSAVFDDGEVVGPNQLGLVERFKAHVDAKQDLMEEIDARLAKGDSMKTALEAVRNTISPETGELPTTAPLIYQQSRRQYFAELEATEKNFGEESARRALALHKYAVRPSIHRRAAGKEDK